MNRSIRWSFAFWQSSILVVVVVALATYLLVELRAATFDEVDAELRGVAIGLASAVVGPPRGRVGRPQPPPFRLSPALEAYFGTGRAEDPYFRLWSPSGRLVEGSGAEGDARLAVLPSRPAVHGDTVLIDDRGDRREALVVPGRRGGLVLVGRSIRPELERLARLQAIVILGALAALVIGLVCGWLVARRVVRPIERMSRTAEAIATDDSSRRLDVSRGPVELERLAGVLNRAFDRLQAAYEDQKRFVADASHELRTPLAVVLTEVQHVLSRERDADRYREALETCGRSAERMRRLADQLSALSSMDSGCLEIIRVDCDLAELVADVVDALSPLAQARAIRIHQEVAPCRLAIDPDRFAEILTNLVSNAIRYGREGGSIWLRVEERESQVVLEVEDDGDGIAPEHRARVFERFYRVDASRSRRAGGTGLGLAITRELVEVHGGSISCDEATSGGARFRLVFPRAT